MNPFTVVPMFLVHVVSAHTRVIPGLVCGRHSSVYSGIQAGCHRGIWHCHMSRWDRYVLRPRIWMETSRSGTVPHIGPYNLVSEPYRPLDPFLWPKSSLGEKTFCSN